MPLALPELRRTELIDLTEDGRKVLWSTGRVQPIGTFETTDGGRWIEPGHYGHRLAGSCHHRALRQLHGRRR